MEVGSVVYILQLDTFFSVMRLLVPQADKSRPAYGLKETALAKQCSDILNIAKDSRDAKKLLNYRAPTVAQQVRKGGREGGKEGDGRKWVGNEYVVGWGRGSNSIIV